MANNIYQHRIELKKVEIRNSKEDFKNQLIELPFRGYEVETLSNGNKIVITKPGGKTVFGKPKKEDFLVYIFYPEINSLWQISHKQIFEDIKQKSEENKSETKMFIDLLERTLNGEEPNDFIDQILNLDFKIGETPETIIKVYKWIWGQEDVNYPNGEGRYMSWKSIKDLQEEIND